MLTHTDRRRRDADWRKDVADIADSLSGQWGGDYGKAAMWALSTADVYRRNDQPALADMYCEVETLLRRRADTLGVHGE